MGNVCLRKKKKKILIDDNVPVPMETPKNTPNTNIILTSNPPIETPDMSINMQTLHHQTPRSEYSRKSTSRIQPVKNNLQSNFDNNVSHESYSFINNNFDDLYNDSKSFRIFGTNNKSEMFNTLQNESIPSFNAISNNDLLLITEENVEILKYLSHYNPSGPYYFNDIHHSKTELNSSAQKYIFKKNPVTKSRSFDKLCLN
jgi:hypothetical protein